MIERHVGDQDLAMFAMGALHAGAGEVESHLRACSHCAARLRSEARLEMALQEVARAPRSRTRRRVRRGLQLAGGLAAAAVLAMLLLPLLRRHTRPATTDGLAIVCLDGLDQAQCQADARQHGLVVSYPTSEIPRYEELSAGIDTSRRPPSGTGARRAYDNK
jgi:hypothetical protein